MSAEQIRDFFNTHFVAEGEQPKTAYIALTIHAVDTGQVITLPSLKTDAQATLYDIFYAVNEYLKQNSLPATPDVPHAAPDKVLRVTPIVHNKKNYFVEQRQSGAIIIQDNQRNVLTEGKTYQAIIKKYEADQIEASKEK